MYNLPLMLDVARDIERICPNAWLIQSGNPVHEGTTLIVRQTGRQDHRPVPRPLWLQQRRQRPGPRPGQGALDRRPGLNHIIWLTEFRYEGQDAYPILDDVDRHRGRGLLAGSRGPSATSTAWKTR